MAQHWYDANGNPKYTVTKKDGKERDTHLGDARKLGLVPSVTTLFGLLAKPGLDMWKQEKLLDASWNHKNSLFSGYDVYKKVICSYCRDEQDKAPKLGNEIHNALEEAYKNNNTFYVGKHEKIVNEVQKIIIEEIGRRDWKAESSFCHTDGFGGKVDLHSEDGIVVDFKTKSTGDVKKMKGFREHIMQLAAYREGLAIPNARCYNLFISTETPGLVVLQEYTEKELSDSWEMFKCLLKYWQIDNNML